MLLSQYWIRTPVFQLPILSESVSEVGSGAAENSARKYWESNQSEKELMKRLAAESVGKSGCYSLAAFGR